MSRRYKKQKGQKKGARKPPRLIVVKPKQPRKQKKGGNWKRKLGGFAKTIGSVVEPVIPGASRVGAAVSRLLGNGAYRATGSGIPLAQPMDQPTIIHYREMIGPVTATTAFSTAYRLELNPGLSSTFPWLAQIAENFEKYQFLQLVFTFESTSGTAVSTSGNGALGQMIGVTQYDPNAPAFQSLSEALNYSGAQSAVPYQSQIFGVECKPKLNPLQKYYVRTGPLQNAEDKKFYDPGTFNMLSSGAQTDYGAGQLWVTYSVAFYEPKLPDASTSAGATTSVFAGITQTATFTLGAAGITYTPMSGSSLDCVISNRALAISARPQPRYVLVTQSCTCTSQVINWPTWTVAGGIFTGYYWGLTLATLTLPAAGVTNNGFFRSACIYIPAATACTLSVTDNASPPTGSITSNLSVELLDASLWVTLAKNKGRQDIEEIKVDVGELSRQYNLLEKLVRRLLDEDDEEQVTSNGKRMSRQPRPSLKLDSPVYVEETEIRTRK